MTDQDKRAKRAAYMREWSKRNPEKVAAASAKARIARADANREYAKAYYLENRDRLLLAAKARYTPGPKVVVVGKSRDERLAKNREWHHANRDKRLTQKREWSSANRSKGAAYAARRRAVMLQATPAWANDFFIEEAYDLAAVRSRVTGQAWEVDHIVPLISDLVCGLHVEHNLRVALRATNRAKGNRHWPEMP